MKVYPRLAQRELKSLIASFASVAPPSSGISRGVAAIRAIVDESPMAPARISHPPVGTELVSGDDLRALRVELRRVAAEFGYPDAEPKGKKSKSAYDRETARVLHRQAGISACDAGSRDMWAHFNGWLLADLVLWRWGSKKSGPDEGRWGLGGRGTVRNQFGRLWWRSETLGDLYWEGRLGEDQVVALLERPAVGFNLPLSRAVASMFIERREDFERDGAKAELVMREVTKHLRRLLPSQAVYSLPGEEVGNVVTQAFDLTIAAVGQT